MQFLKLELIIAAILRSAWSGDGAATSPSADTERHLSRKAMTRLVGIGEKGERNKKAGNSINTRNLSDRELQMLDEELDFPGACYDLPAGRTPDGNPDDGWVLAMGPNDDGSTLITDFNFNFYGTTFNSVWINNNGNLSFGSPYSSFSSTGFPSSSFAMIAPFWGDVDTRGSLGHVWVKKIGTDQLAVTWDTVGYYSYRGELRNTFQVLISGGLSSDMGPGNNVCFCYHEMQWTTGYASGGSNGYGGTPATVGANKGDGVNFFQIGRFDHEGTDYDGPNGSADGVSWLDHKAFCLNAAAETGNIPPIAADFPDDRTINLECGETLDTQVQFLSPEAGQTTTVTFDSSALPQGLTITTTEGEAAVVSLSSDGTIPPGAYPITLTATDDGTPSPESTTETLTINVLEGPLCSLPFVEALCQEAGTVSIPTNQNIDPFLLDAGSNEEGNTSSIASMSVSPSMFTCSDLGANSVTLMVVGNGGDTDTCTTNVVVEDTTPPSAVCKPATVTIADASNPASIVASDIDNGSSYGCGSGDSLLLSQTNFDCEHVGDNTVVLTVTNGAGDTASCTSTVTVIDLTPPSAVCKDTSVVLGDTSGSATIVVSDVDNGSSSGCGGDVDLQLSQTLFSCQHVGDNTVTLLATDEAGNTASCTATVTVEDVTAPTVVCTDSIVELDASGSATIVVSDIGNGSSGGCGGDVSLQLSQTIFSCQHVGDNTVSLVVTDEAGNTSSCSSTVTVIDVTAPSAVCKDTSVVLDTTSDSATIVVSDIDNGSSDECGGDVSLQLSQTLFSCQHIGDNTVSLVVTDEAGNTSSCTAAVTVLNLTPPSAVCKDTSSVLLDASGSATIEASDIDDGSIDACGRDVSLQLSQTIFSCQHVGDNTVSLVVTDEAGNTSSCSSTVTVIDVTAPYAVCRDTSVVLDTTSGSASIVASNIDDGSSDGCGGDVSLQLSQTLFSCQHVGDNTVSLVVTDEAGNTSSCTAAVTVLNLTPPSAVCKDTSSVFLGASGSATIEASDIDDGSSDACGGDVSLQLSQTIFSCQHVGDNTVSLVVTDEAGNTSSCSSTVTVIDVTAPTAVCRDTSVVLDTTSDSATVVVSDIDNGSSDGCGGDVSLQLSQTLFSCQHIGDNTVSLVVTDEAGNTSSCTAAVTVLNLTPPSAVCKDSSVLLDASGSASIEASDIDDGSSDACGGDVSLQLSQTLFSCQHVGDNTVLLVVTDATGNTATCSSTITVIDVTPPSAVCMDSIVELDASGSASIVASNIDNGSSDTCGGEISLELSQTQFDCQHLGDNSVLLSAKDEAGNIATCFGTVTVKDVTPPSAFCTDSLISLDANGNANIMASNIDNGSTDECGGAVTLQLSQTDFSCNHVGENVVTLTVTDESENQNTCTGTVIVLNEAPTVDSLESVVVFVDGASGSPSSNGDLTILANEPEGQNLSYSWTASDDCGNGFFASTQSTNIAFAKGTEPKVCSITAQTCDICGSCASQTAFVFVVDPAAGFVTGGGWIQSPAGAYREDPSAEGKASFGFNSKYKKGQSVPDGNIQFNFPNVGLDFSSTSSQDWLVVTENDCAKFQGIGKVGAESEAGHGFMVTVCDNGEPSGGDDTFRIKIWSLDDVDKVIYDNHMGQPDDSYIGSGLGGGNIQIHRSGGNNKKRMLRSVGNN